MVQTGGLLCPLPFSLSPSMIYLVGSLCLTTHRQHMSNLGVEPTIANREPCSTVGRLTDTVEIKVRFVLVKLIFRFLLFRHFCATAYMSVV